MNRVVYTCLFGGYDILGEAPTDLVSADMVCFTDDLGIDPNGWQLEPVPDTDDLGPVRQSRFAKILPHRLLGNYDESLYIDCNVRLKADVSSLFAMEDLWISPAHPDRSCIFFEEAAAILRWRAVEDVHVLMDQVRRYKLSGMPNNAGLTENCFILRKHNHKRVVALSEMWWEEYLNGCTRDQLSLPFAAWKSRFPIHTMNRDTCNQVFRKVEHIEETSLRKARRRQKNDARVVKSLKNSKSGLLHNQQDWKISAEELKVGVVTHRDATKINSGSSRLRGGLDCQILAEGGTLQEKRNI